MDFLELLIGQVGIDLGGRNIGVAQKRLDRTQVGAVYKKVGGKRVSDLMGVDFFGMPAFWRRKKLISERNGDLSGRLPCSFWSGSRKGIPRYRFFFQIVFNGFFGPLRQKNHPELVAFSAHGYFAPLQIQIAGRAQSSESRRPVEKNVSKIARSRSERKSFPSGAETRRSNSL